MSEISKFYDVDERDFRQVVSPIKRKAWYNMYLKQQSLYWIQSEISFNEDRKHYIDKLTVLQKELVKKILAFFAFIDTLVNLNIMERFKDEIGSIMEARLLLNFIAAMEDIHAITYARKIDEIISGDVDRDAIHKIISDEPVIAKLANWVSGWRTSNKCLASRLVGMICVEGIIFQGSFYAIDCFSPLGLMPGLRHANEFIRRDEGLHTETNIMFYNDLKSEVKLDKSEVIEIMTEAIQIADEFIDFLIPESNSFINADVFKSYNRGFANTYLLNMRCGSHWKNALAPLSTKKNTLANVSNFFEYQPTEYKKIATPDDAEIDMDF